MNKLNEFIQIIGKKRFIFLAVLLGFTVVVGFIWQQWLLPNHSELSSQKTTVEGDRDRLQRELNELPLKYKELQANEERYQKLIASGFTMNQDRIVARSNIDTIRMRTGLRGISYNISPQETVVNPQGAQEDQIAMTKIDVDMKGLTDLEMRDFISRMRSDFRGLVVVRGLSLKRENEPTESKLLDLKNKKAIDFVTGKVSLEWYTVLPKPQEGSEGAP